MKFNIRVLVENDYDDILVPWWKEWGWTPPVRDWLPLNGLGGIMIEWDNTPVCAGFVIQTNTKVAWVDWIVSNKNFRLKTQRSDGLHLLVQTLTDVAKRQGHKYVYALLKNSPLVNVYLNNGYIKGEKYNIEMIKAL
jgi:hypothetical protein